MSPFRCKRERRAKERRERRERHSVKRSDWNVFHKKNEATTKDTVSGHQGRGRDVREMGEASLRVSVEERWRVSE